MRYFLCLFSAITISAAGCSKPSPVATPEETAAQSGDTTKIPPTAEDGAQHAKHTEDSITGKVVKVLDGDSLEVELAGNISLKVKLVGIDAPDISQDYGQDAATALTNKTLRRTVSLTSHGKDQFGRTLADIYIGDRWINRELVSEGYAWHLQHNSDDKNLASAEKAARDAKAGLWSDKNPKAPWDFRKDNDVAETPDNGSSSIEESQEQIGSENDAIEYAKSVAVKYPELQPKASRQVVFVTRSGQKYHSVKCSHLRGINSQISIEEAKRKYTACEVCGGRPHTIRQQTNAAAWLMGDYSDNTKEWSLTGKVNDQQFTVTVFLNRNGDWSTRSVVVGGKTVFEDGETPSQSEEWDMKIAAAEQTEEKESKEAKQKAKEEAKRAAERAIEEAKRAEKAREEAIIAEQEARENRAAGQVQMARELIERGKKKFADRRLKRIIEEFPDTEAALDAEELLTGRRPPKKKLDIARKNRSGSAKPLPVFNQETIKQLKKTAERQPTAKDALKIYDAFLSQDDLDDDVRQAAESDRIIWKQRADQGLERLGPNWVPRADVAAAKQEADTLMQQAFALWQVSEFQESEKMLVEASKADENGILADFTLGMYFSIAGHYDTEMAEKHFRVVLQRFPDHVPAMNNLALTLMKQKDYDAALNYWTQAVKLSPRTPEVTQNLGRLIKEASRKKVRVPATLLAKYSKLYSEAITAGNGRPSEANIGWIYSPPVLPKAERDRGGLDKPDLPQNYVATGSGSGFVVANEYLLTNRHVINNDRLGISDRVVVISSTGTDQEKEMTATVVAVSETADLALLRCKGLDQPPLLLKNELPKRGTELLILGFPLGERFGRNIKTTKGIVSALPDGKKQNDLYFDAEASPGNSGGPVCDNTGVVIGILTWKNNLLDLTGGVTSVDAIKFLKEQSELELHQQQDHNSRKLEWAEVDAKVSPSVVFLVTYHNSPTSVFQQRGKVANHRDPIRIFEDRTCSACSGHSHIDCPQRGCNRGSVTVMEPYTFVRGVGRNRTVFTNKRAVRKRCPTCAGKGRIDCPACSNGSDPSLK